MATIEDQIKQDHKKFHRHYTEIICRHSRHIFKINQASEKEDKTEGFDYFINLNKVNIAVRNRTFYYYDKFKDFTIRAKSKNGHKTEIHKIREGMGDIYLYAWQTASGKNIHSYLIVDLDKFRESKLAFLDKQAIKNGDGTSFFSYSLSDLYKNECVIAYNKF